MARYAVKGCKFSIGGVLDDKSTDFVAADFTSQTWTEITEWVTMGDFGDEAADIVSQIIGEGRDKHAKGTRNAGQIENMFNHQVLDAGVIASKVAEKSSFNYAFKIEMNDKPSAGASPKNSVINFVGLVQGAKQVGGGANTNRMFRLLIQPNSNFVETPASPT